ncbi:hypothetical protein KOW79_020550 [Hemibagrus wyckioides]|uniref:Arb2 domain-containing protein n=1 Tax=Hemibagrus wyckioides TaxID=337641 RepID=A0A9D3N488_9TELE|nr:hypothetical protein KOW79_020550 [Hemibagrus wyckioides]
MLESSEVNKKTPSDFPYSFTEDGHLCHVATLKPYKFPFQLKDVQATMREHTTLCCYISQHVYSLLENKCNLIKVYLDKGSRSDSPAPGFVYMSPGALGHHGMLMVLIQGKGTIRCGVWSWRAVAHEGLERGSQIPYVRWALEESCAVLLMNPNEEAMTPEEHVLQVGRDTTTEVCSGLRRFFTQPVASAARPFGTRLDQGTFQHMGAEQQAQESAGGVTEGGV